MRTIQIHPLSLTVGAVAVSAAFVLTAQTTAPAQTTWPPPKAMIVNVYRSGPSQQVPAQGTVLVATVPNDRWLTVTGASIGAPGPFGWLEQDSNGVIVEKGRASTVPEIPAGCGGPVGWTFAPGSSILLQNFTANTETLTGYTVIGYYSRN